MRRKIQFPKGKNVCLQVFGVCRGYTHPDGREMTREEQDAVALGFIPGVPFRTRELLASFGPTSSRHLWLLYSQDSRYSREWRRFHDLEREWNGVLETNL